MENSREHRGLEKSKQYLYLKEKGKKKVPSRPVSVTLFNHDCQNHSRDHSVSKQAENTSSKNGKQVYEEEVEGRVQMPLNWGVREYL